MDEEEQMSYAGHHPRHAGLQRHSVGGIYPLAVVIIGEEALISDLTTDTYYVPEENPQFTVAEAYSIAERLRATCGPTYAGLLVWRGITEARLQLEAVRAEPGYIPQRLNHVD
jgi:hypothetical protein